MNATRRTFARQSLTALIALAAFSMGAIAQDSSDVVLQKETVRRQELVLKATRKLDEASQLIQLGKEAEASALIDEVLASVPKAGEAQPVYEKASRLQSMIRYNEAVRALEAKKYFDARDLAKKSLELNPGNAQAQAILTECNTALGIKPGEDKPSNPSIDAKFVDNLNKVNGHIKKAQDLMGTGQYDLAEKELEQALAIDPYNKVAAFEQQKLYTKMRKSNEIATKTTRQSKLTGVREGWTEVYAIDNPLAGDNPGYAPIQAKSTFQVSQKLQTLMIPQVDFTDASIDDMARFLTAKSREVDPAGLGVSFIVKNEQARKEARNFNLKLKNVPVGEVLRYACNLAGVKYKMQEFAVFIVPLSDSEGKVLVTREFPVPPDFIDTSGLPAGGGGDAGAGGRRRPRTVTDSGPASGGDRVRQALEARGVEFPEGATAIYNAATGILTVKNTQDQIDLIEELVTVDQGETLMVKVETKLIEINQTDLDSLSFNYFFAGTYTYPANLSGLGSRFAAGSTSGQTNLQGAGGITEADGINSIINLNDGSRTTAGAAYGGSAAQPANTAVTGNRFGISGVLDGNQFTALLEALSQKTSSDLLTAPAIVVKDGEQGSILVAREFYYPTEFDAPQVVNRSLSVITVGIDATSFAIAPIVVPAWPTEFENRNVGVSMVVQPRVSVDRQRVVLTLKPEITEFDGFINYGGRIFTDRDANGELIVSTAVNDNIINQPVFTTRTVDNAQMEIQDGYTMVLGGLIREDISTVDDKVPLLGDLPLVGRLFRSKAEQAIKKNMLIFVTVRILRPDGEPFNVGSVAASQ